MVETYETIGQFKEKVRPQAKAILVTMEDVLSNHKSLGEAGKKKATKNQFGDMAMTADVEAENVTLTGVCKYSESTNSVIVFDSEEKGKGIIRKGQVEYWQRDDNSKHELQIDGLLVVDGLDGSENYANKTNWPYGTMVAMADVANPKYDNFTTAAVCMEEEGWIVLATTEGENPGVFVIDNSNGNVHKLSKFDQTGDFNEANILADNYFAEAKALIENRLELGERRTGSTAATVVSMVIRNLVTDYQYPEMNKLHEILVDVTRKGNLEQPIVYLMLQLLGGDVLDINGNSIGDKNFKEWGQQDHLAIFPMTNITHFEKLKEHLGLKEVR